MSDTARPISFAFVAAVNDHGVLEQCLKRSPDVASGRAPLITREGFSSAASALNSGIDAADADVVVCLHQDVYLPDGWLARLEAHVRELEADGVGWAVLGVSGLDQEGRFVARVWSTDVWAEQGGPGFGRVEAVCLDECLLVVNRRSGLRFDEALPHFHLYGLDLVQEGRRRGLKSFVIEAPLVHHSLPVRTIRGGYTLAYRYMQRKWADRLPLRTLIVDLKPGSWVLHRHEVRRVKMRVKRWFSARLGRSEATRTQSDPASIARDLGY